MQQELLALNVSRSACCTFSCDNNNKSFQHFFQNCSIKEMGSDVSLSYFVAKLQQAFWA
jgi:hypothetical protein